MRFDYWPRVRFPISGLFFVIFCTCVMILWPGCKDEPEKFKPDGQVTILFWNTMNEHENATLKKLLIKFSERNPGLKVEVQNLDFADARDKIEQGIKKGIAPDVIRVDRFWIPSFASEGIIEPISGGTLEEELADLLPIARDAVTFNDQVWGFPHTIDCLALFYNKRHFKDAGVEPPEDFDSFKDIARKLTDPASGRFGFFMNPSPWWFEPFLLAFGGRYFDSDGNLAINSEHTLRALQYLLDLKDHEKVMPPVNLRHNAYDLMMQSFIDGQVSMIISGPWAIREVVVGRLFRPETDNLGIAQIPKGPHGRFPPIGCHSLSLSKNSRNRSAALKFISFLCSSDSLQAFSAESYSLPTRRSHSHLPRIKDNSLLKPFLSQLQTGKILEHHDDVVKMYDALEEPLMKILNGDAPPQDVLKDLDTVWNSKK